MKPQLRVDFTQLAVQRIGCKANEVKIAGGKINADEVSAWLNQWDLNGLRWRLWVEVSALRLEEDSALPNDFSLIERGRFFGEAGDLTLRRDGNDFRWWFVGSQAFKLPEKHGGRDFWSELTQQNKTLYRIEQEAILWGAHQGKDQNGVDFWYDDSVGYAKLNYPTSLAGKRHIYAKYWEYLDSGRVAAVWMYALEGRSE